MYYDLGHVHSNLGEFQYRFVMQTFRFSVPPLLPHFPSSNVISSWSISTHGFIMVHRSCAFSRCMVDYTMMTIFVFHFIWGHVPGGWICCQYSTGRTSSDFNENQPKHQKQELPRDFLQLFVMKFCLLPSFNLILDIPITKLTELWL